MCFYADSKILRPKPKTMWHARCPYCRSSTPGRSATTPSGRSVAECSACGRVVAERQLHTHNLFLRRASDKPLPLVTSDLPSVPSDFLRSSADGVGGGGSDGDDDDPFHPTGFITAFSTWSLEHTPVLVRAASSFAGHLAELERVLLDCSSSTSSSDKENKNKDRDGGGALVSVDHLRAYLQILEVSSILGLDHDIVDHAFQLFKDCSNTICLRNRSIEALATATLVHAIREAQEPRTLQEISTASNLPQKEIGKYIKILGEALQLSQPINSNSISVHMPRFCNLLQLNKSAQELAAHIGEVVVNKCFCTRRNPISISAAAIYLACQLEDKRKTQAEICKVTGLTEVTLRKVYKELLENWDDLLPPKYTPAVPPEKAFPMNIGVGRSWTPKFDAADSHHVKTHQDFQADASLPDKQMDAMETNQTAAVIDVEEGPHGHSHTSVGSRDLNQAPSRQSQGPLLKPDGGQSINLNEMKSSLPELEHKFDMNSTTNFNKAPWMGQAASPSSSKIFINLWPSAASQAAPQSYAQIGKQQLDLNFATPFHSSGNSEGEDDAGFLQ